ncbi:MAG TPA: KH domain-containing protein, partial [Candidatus Gracilibacteria bacterium]
DQELHVSDADRPEFQQRYFHHYNFPPFSVGEVRPLRGPGRREIGHGALAERALKYVVPGQDQGFMYTMRVVSEVLSCNGSSSMASVCGSTLALMDGGVPLKTPIAGIAMGLLMDSDSGDYRILTDIQGLEDFDGDMDFKVTGDKENITCLQLDIKIKGLKLELLAEALKKAKVARSFILDEMAKNIQASRTEMSSYAPLIESLKIKEDQIGMIIGKGGETIQGMQKDYEVNISVEDDGTVTITGLKEGIAKAKKQIESMTHEPEVGEVFENATVKTVLDFGAFVEFLPKQDALLHVSEFGLGRIEKAADHIEVGQKIKVKITEKDRQGRYKLTWLRD